MRGGKVSEQTKFVLKNYSANINSPFDRIEADEKVYIGGHNNGKTLCDFEVTVKRVFDGFESHIDLGSPICKGEDESIIKLADWMERAAKAIRKNVGGGDE